MGLLNRTRVYLAGNLENSSDTTNWREYVEEELSKIGIICFNPMHKNFVTDTAEDDEFRNAMIKRREAGDWDTVHDFMKGCIQKDLRLIDISDYVIFKFEFDKPTYGTLHEFWVAQAQKKPCFVIAEHKNKVPLWLVGLLPEKYIYSSIDEVIDMLNRIDRGYVKADSKRWRLLKENLR